MTFEDVTFASLFWDILINRDRRNQEMYDYTYIICSHMFAHVVPLVIMS